MNSYNEIFKFGKIDDLIFFGRNKSYGAYDLRITYEERLKKSIILLLLLTVGFISTMVVYEKIIGKVDLTSGTYNNVTEFTHQEYNNEVDKPAEIEKPIEKPIDKPQSTPELEVNQIPNPKIVSDAKTEFQETKTAIEGKGIIGDIAKEGDPNTGQTPIQTTGQGQGGIVESILDDKDVDVSPEFPGGDLRMGEFIQDAIDYPELEQDMGIRGQVNVEFVVNEDGSISNVELEKKDRENFNREALRVIKSMPKWKPGMQGGHAVKVRLILPLSFN